MNALHLMTDRHVVVRNDPLSKQFIYPLTQGFIEMWLPDEKDDGEITGMRKESKWQLEMKSFP